MSNSASSDKIKSSNYRLVIGTLVGASFVFSVAGFGLSVYNTLGGRLPYYGLYSWYDGNSATFVEGSISDIVSQVSPSVVSIVTESTFSSAAGTGMVVTKDGYILTNKHVVESGKKFQVVMHDGTVYSDVTLVGTDPLNDVAFIKINGVSNLQPVTLGDSKTLTAGQQVIAIGNALGQYQNTVTEGIISGTGRSLIATDSSNYSNYERLSDMIQTDASINSGNSGGPLINAGGQVIGINTAVYSDGNGIGFAIPISSVKGMLKSIIEKGKAERAYIGVSYVMITPSVQKQYNLPVSEGAYVSSENGIIAGGPAEKAGLKNGDIITAVDGIKIGSAGSLSTLIGEHSAGETVELTILRNGEEQKIKLTTAVYLAD
ncbi:trypsin-like peptidase domain-containing protein [Candidatus Saccharibacteria bacterium]|nr:trypsin-like peptidase domain-containing protein [Candidatus Saccharibacteria bacterium]